MPMTKQTKTHPADGLLSTREAARRVGVSPNTLKMWKRQHRIRPVSESRRGDRWELESVRAVANSIQTNRRGGPLRETTANILSAMQTPAVLDAVLSAAARAALSAGDTVTERWLAKLLRRGDRASGVVAGPQREKRQRA